MLPELRLKMLPFSLCFVYCPCSQFKKKVQLFIFFNIEGRGVDYFQPRPCIPLISMNLSWETFNPWLSIFCKKRNWVQFPIYLWNPMTAKILELENLSLWRELSFFLSINLNLLLETKWVLATNLDFLFPIYLQPDVVDLWYFNLWILYNQIISKCEIQTLYTIRWQDIRIGKW